MLRPRQCWRGGGFGAQVLGCCWGSGCLGIAGALVKGLGFRVTWTPKVCRIIAFYRLWAIILPTFGGLVYRGFSQLGFREVRV